MSNSRDKDVSTYVFGLVPKVIFYPFTYFKTLTQLGHEPLPPHLGNQPPWVFSRAKCWYYPNGFKYLGHVWEEDGFFGLYRGLGPHLCCSIVSNFTVAKVSDILDKQGLKPDEIDSTDSELEAWQKIIKKNCVHSFTNVAGVVVGYPFHVIMVRSMAQFIGKEHIYDNSLGSFREIFNQEGISGFFSGLVPRLLGEVLTIWLANSLIFVCERYIFKEKKEDPMMSQFAKAIAWFSASAATYSLFAVSTIMIVNGCPSLVAGVEPLGMRTFEQGWKQCLEHLKKHGAQKRGSSIFYRACLN